MSHDEISGGTARRSRTTALLSASAALALAALPLLAPVADAAPTHHRPPRPVTTTTTTTATTPTTATAAATARVVALTNAERAKVGCGALVRDARLDRAAQGHADWMNATGTFSHTGANGSTFVDRLRAQGYPSPGGENIAYGYPTPDAVVTAWMNSPGHRRNILDCSFRTIGVGLAGSRYYWVQDFGR